MISVYENISLKPYNTFGLESIAKYFIKIDTADDIKEFLQSGYSVHPRFILGEGSNVLFTGQFNGVVLHNEIKGIEVIEKKDSYVLVKVACGENWDSFVSYCVEKNFGGIENLSFIPGSVGASPIQNIGAYGVEVKDVIKSVEAVDLETGKLVFFKNKDCRFEYRDSVFKGELKNKFIITYVVFRLSTRHKLVTHYGNIEKELQNYPEKTIANVRDIVIKTRKEKLPNPVEFGNAGSFFKNPLVKADVAEEILKIYPVMPFWNAGEKIKLSAAWLIEQGGMKGKRIGNTGTYPKQPLVIVNYGNATGGEILGFSNEIKKAVFEKFGIELETEVNII